MTEIIGKIQSNPNNYKINFLYYNRARDAMFDVINELYKKGYENIYIPGYIGWSPKEGSGIFDPLKAIIGLTRHYYQMTNELLIDSVSLNAQMKDNSMLLIVNYFGFRNPGIRDIIETAHKKGCIVIEDNAHGFYTYFCYGSINSDITFFSLHKMFPFSKGGGLVVEKGYFEQLHDLKKCVDFDPFQYNYNAIANKRVKNYRVLLNLVKEYGDYFEPLRGEEYLEKNIPQTFPIQIKKGDRDQVYEIMNTSGYGVVSLYHTMIEELKTKEHERACKLASCIMNLPVHQDCDPSAYVSMIIALKEACEQTNKN